MILITGSTGQLGKSTIEFLLQRIPADQIAALVRDEGKAASLKAAGIETRLGNYDDKESLVAAFAGTDKLFFISANDVAIRQKQHQNVVEAAKEAGVKHIVYTSFARKNETGSNPLGIVAVSHIETDRMIKESGIPYTILLNNLYADVLPQFFGSQVLEKGIFLPAGDGRASYIKRAEIAEIAASILTSEGHEGKEYAIANAENYSLQDAAGILSDLSNKPVKYINPSAEQYSETLGTAGVPADAVAFLAAFSEAIKQGEFETAASDTERFLGRKPSTLRDFLKETYFPQK